MSGRGVPGGAADAARRWLAALAVCAGAAACGGAAGTAGMSVRDSAGIRIVEHTDGERGVTWRVAEAPALDLGVLEGDEDYQFFQVTDAAAWADGRLVVANSGTHELRFYDAAGGFLRRVGRQGDGPGEYQAMGRLDLFAGGDSIGVYDWRLRRISVYDAGGTFVRSFPLQFPAGSPRPEGPFDDGAWLASTNMVFGTGDVSGVRRDTSAYYVFDADGALVDSLFAFPRWEMYVQGDEGFVMAQSLPFGRGAAGAVFGDGFWAGITDRYEITRYGRDGTPQLIVRKHHTHLPVTQADIDAVKGERLDDQTDANVRRRFERMYEEMPIAETMPAFASLATDADGNLWVSDFMRPGAAETTWAVYAPDGRRLATVATPDGFRPYAIGRDALVGAWTDDLGVEHVRVYPLLKPVS